MRIGDVISLSTSGLRKYMMLKPVLGVAEI